MEEYKIEVEEKGIEREIKVEENPEAVIISENAPEGFKEIACVYSPTHPEKGIYGQIRKGVYADYKKMGEGIFYGLKAGKEILVEKEDNLISMYVLINGENGRPKMDKVSETLCLN